MVTLEKSNLARTSLNTDATGFPPICSVTMETSVNVCSAFCKEKKYQYIMEASKVWLDAGETRPEDITDVAKHCRKTKLYKPEMKRIIYTVEDEQLGKAMAASLVLEGAQRKVGRAPKGELQRQLSSWLAPYEI